MGFFTGQQHASSGRAAEQVEAGTGTQLRGRFGDRDHEEALRWRKLRQDQDRRFREIAH